MINNFKIAVCMWYDETIKEYANISYKINKRYCDLYKYDLIYSNKRSLPNRHQAWERFPMLLHVLNLDYYDYVMWIDADACFNLNCEIGLKTIINLSKQKDILFSSDNNSNSNIPINTGVIIFKNTDFSKQFIKNVINSEDIEQCRSRFNLRLWEQDCVTHIYNKNLDIKRKSLIYEYGILQLFSSDINKETKNFPLVYHFMSLSNSERIKKLREF